MDTQPVTKKQIEATGIVCNIYGNNRSAD
ncbi:hypothethical protein (plasmid) [Ralstonia solanacearum CMR15]|nr:hypothethical protein [Ralstonia solanacearum CMR15]